MIIVNNRNSEQGIEIQNRRMGIFFPLYLRDGGNNPKIYNINSIKTLF